jgi:hypothetical protein
MPARPAGFIRSVLALLSSTGPQKTRNANFREYCPAYPNLTFLKICEISGTGIGLSSPFEIKGAGVLRY